MELNIWQKMAGGQVDKSNHREYGRAKMLQTGISNELLDGLSYESQVWMSHGDTIGTLPNEFEIIAKSDSIPLPDLNGTDNPIRCMVFNSTLRCITARKDWIY